MEFLVTLGLYLNIAMFFIVGFILGTPKIKYIRYCCIILSVINIGLTVIDILCHNVGSSVIHGFLIVYWFVLSFLYKRYEDKFLK